MPIESRNDLERIEAAALRVFMFCETGANEDLLEALMQAFDLGEWGKSRTCVRRYFLQCLRFHSSGDRRET